jgi:hypothetical protein
MLHLNRKKTAVSSEMNVQLYCNGPSFLSVDAASAEKQHFCPVTGDLTGVPSPPQNIDVNGQQLWIYYEDCKDQWLGKPDEYLAKSS